jgi:CubicO group peptidase (beta-lactamase class C family)
MKWSAAVGRTATVLDFSLDGFFTPLKFAPGDGWYYGTATDWAGQALERVCGQSLGAYMQEHVLAPLGMRDTGFWPDKMPHVAARTAAFSVRESHDQTLKPIPSPVPERHPVESGGAGLFSTAADYAKVLRAVLGNDRLVVGGETITDALFAPRLDETQRAMLMAIADAFHDMFAPEFPRGTELDFAFGGLMNLTDIPRKRRKGSLMWSGMPNSRWVRFVSALKTVYKHVMACMRLTIYSAVDR